LLARNEHCVAASHSNIIEIKEYPVSPPPIVTTLRGDSAFCPGDSLVIISKDPSRGVFQWIKYDNGLPQNIPNAILPAYIVYETGDYTTTYVDSNGCFSEYGNIVPISHYEVPDPPQILPPVAEYYYGLNYLLTLYMPKNEIYYEWYKGGASTGVTGSDFYINKLGSEDITRYAVRGTNEYGCNALSPEYVILEASRRFFIPNIFTPNGDGINDILEIVGLEAFIENKLEIINKKGVLVHSVTNYNNDWNGESCPSDIYFYSLTVKSEDGRTQTHKGFFHIKRENW
jgi:gliding motility-associated-like protein